MPDPNISIDPQQQQVTPVDRQQQEFTSVDPGQEAATLVRSDKAEKQEEAPVDCKQQEAIVAERLKRASAIATGSTTLLIAAAVSFLLLLFQNTLVTPLESRQEYLLENWNRRIAEKEKQLDKLRNPRGGPLGIPLNDVPPAIKQLSDDISDLRRKHDELQAQLTNDIELPLSIKLHRSRVPSRSIPLVDAALGLAGLIFLIVQRRQILVLAARSVRDLKVYCKLTPGTLGERMPAPPFWLAPLPQSITETAPVSIFDLQEVFGWEDRYVSRVAGSAAVAAAFGVSQALILVLSLQVNLGLLSPDPSWGAPPPANIVLGVATCLCVAMFYFLAYRFWLCDLFGREPAAAKTPAFSSRRDALAALASIAVPTSCWLLLRLTGTSRYALPPKTGRNKRFRIKPQPVARIQRNPNAVEDCVIDQRGGLRFISLLTPTIQPNLRAWKHGRKHRRKYPELRIPAPPVWVSLLAFLREHPNEPFRPPQNTARDRAKPGYNSPRRFLRRMHLGWSIEQAAQEALQRSDIDDAVLLLERGIVLQPLCVRLYDQLSFVAVHYNRPEVMSWLITHTQQALNQGLFRPYVPVALVPRVSRAPTDENETPVPSPSRHLAEQKGRRKQRKRCEGGRLILRASKTVTGKRTISSDSMTQRLHKWQNADSKWRQQQSSKVWAVPGVDRKTKRVCPPPKPHEQPKPA